MSVLSKKADAYFRAAKMYSRGAKDVSPNIQIATYALNQCFEVVDRVKVTLGLTEFSAKKKLDECRKLLELAFEMMKQAAPHVTNPSRAIQQLGGAWEQMQKASQVATQGGAHIVARVITDKMKDVATQIGHMKNAPDAFQPDSAAPVADSGTNYNFGNPDDEITGKRPGEMAMTNQQGSGTATIPKNVQEKLQQWCNSRNYEIALYSNDIPDGIAGKQTTWALNQFKKDNGVTGSIDNSTLFSLILNTPLEAPSKSASVIELARRLRK